MLLNGIPLVDFTLQVTHHARGGLTGTVVEARNGSQTGVSTVTTRSLWKSVSNSLCPGSRSSTNRWKVICSQLTILTAWSHALFLRSNVLHILCKPSVLLLHLSNLWSSIILVDVILPVFQNCILFLSEVSFHLNALVKLFKSDVVNSLSSSKTSDFLFNEKRQLISVNGLAVLSCMGSRGDSISDGPRPCRGSSNSESGLYFPNTVLRANGTLR